MNRPLNRALVSCILLITVAWGQTPELAPPDSQAAPIDTLLRITFPADSSTIALGSVRFGAWVTDTTAIVTVQAETLKVYPSGAVVGMIRLEPGMNEVEFTATTDSVSFDTVYRYFRPEPIVTLPAKPNAIDERTVAPFSNQTYFRPDRIVVRIQGSPGGRAQFKIGHLTGGKLPMVELPLEETGGRGGLYEGVYLIQPGDACKNERVRYWVTGPKGARGLSAKARSGGRITVDLVRQPMLVATTGVESLIPTTGVGTLIYNRPGGEIIMDLPGGIVLQATARIGRWWQVELSSGQLAYTAANGVVPVPLGRSVPRASMHGITAETDSSWLTLTFSMSAKVPFRIAQRTDPERLSLYMHRTTFADEWTRYPDSSNLIDHYDWEQLSADLLRFDIFLNTEQQWGFRASYSEAGFELRIRIPPLISKENPFANLIIALDAGHGGEHNGAAGATGLMEKDVNLAYTLELAAMLEEKGAQVLVTRSTDTTLFLRPRVEMAQEVEAHILIWMHNNSSSLARDPLALQGSSTFYTQVQGLPFSRALYPHLLALGLPPQGIVHRSYFVTRQTDPVIYLVEGAFLSHPLDEMFLMDSENLRRLATAVLRGLEDRLNALAR